MNKKRLTKTIIFLTIGAVSFVPLIFLSEILSLFISERSDANTLRKLELARKISKAFFIILGIIFLMVGIYNLIMMFTEEEKANE